MAGVAVRLMVAPCRAQVGSALMVPFITEAKVTCMPGMKVALTVTLLLGMTNWLSVTVMLLLLASLISQAERQ